MSEKNRIRIYTHCWYKHTAVDIRTALLNNNSRILPGFKGDTACDRSGANAFTRSRILKAHSAWLRMSETACGRFAGLRRKHGNVQRTGANTFCLASQETWPTTEAKRNGVNALHISFR